MYNIIIQNMIRSIHVYTNKEMNLKSFAATRLMSAHQTIQQSRICHQVCIAARTWFLNLDRKRARRFLFSGRSQDKLKYWDSKEMEGKVNGR